MDDDLVYDLSLNDLIEGYRKCVSIEKGVQRRIIIIPNCSDVHSKLAKLLSDEKITFSIDNSKTPLDNLIEIYKGCYIISFRQINLVD